MAVGGPYVLVSPERRWRAAAALVAAAVVGVAAAVVGQPAGGLVAGASSTVLVALAWRIDRTRLEVRPEGLVDRRLLRVRRLRWDELAGDIRVGRPGWLWGGYCVQVTRDDGRRVDLLATRAYSLVPSGRHYDELHRMAWTLDSLRPG